jgi:hypothetical protein
MEMHFLQSDWNSTFSWTDHWAVMFTKDSFIHEHIVFEHCRSFHKVQYRAFVVGCHINDMNQRKVQFCGSRFVRFWWLAFWMNNQLSIKREVTDSYIKIRQHYVSHWRKCFQSLLRKKDWRNWHFHENVLSNLTQKQLTEIDSNI